MMKKTEKKGVFVIGLLIGIFFSIGLVSSSTPGPIRNQNSNNVADITFKLGEAGGNSLLEIFYDLPHPADLNKDFIVGLSEFVSYVICRKQGASCTWQNAPNPIPINYVTNFAALWKATVNGVYRYVPGQDCSTANNCWQSGAS